MSGKRQAGLMLAGAFVLWGLALAWRVSGEDVPAHVLLARVSRSEAGCYSPRDTVAFWQVAQAIGRPGEPLSAALRRLSPSATGTIEPRNARQRKIAVLGLEQGRPEGWTRELWAGLWGRECWHDTLRTARAVVRGRRPPAISGAVPIAWGCDPLVPSAAPWRCWGDVYRACKRRLAPIPHTATRNRFFCRAGSRGCAPEPPPICVMLLTEAGP